MFAQMQFAKARSPENEKLAGLIDEILDLNPEARQFQDHPLTYTHPDGDRRAVNLPIHGRVQLIELNAFAPLRSPGGRIIMLVPIDEPIG